MKPLTNFIHKKLAGYTLRDRPFSMQAKLSEKLTLTLLRRVRIRR